MNFNKIYRAKTPSAQRKIFTYFSEPWRPFGFAQDMLCVFARVRVFPILLREIPPKLSKMFG